MLTSSRRRTELAATAGAANVGASLIIGLKEQQPPHPVINFALLMVPGEWSSCPSRRKSRAGVAHGSPPLSPNSSTGACRFLANERVEPVVRDEIELAPQGNDLSSVERGRALFPER